MNHSPYVAPPRVGVSAGNAYDFRGVECNECEERIGTIWIEHAHDGYEHHTGQSFGTAVKLGWFPDVAEVVKCLIELHEVSSASLRVIQEYRRREAEHG